MKIFRRNPESFMNPSNRKSVLLVVGNFTQLGDLEDKERRAGVDVKVRTGTERAASK